MAGVLAIQNAGSVTFEPFPWNRVQETEHFLKRLQRFSRRRPFNNVKMNENGLRFFAFWSDFKWSLCLKQKR